MWLIPKENARGEFTLRISRGGNILPIESQWRKEQAKRFMKSVGRTHKLRIRHALLAFGDTRRCTPLSEATTSVGVPRGELGIFLIYPPPPG